jgi:hypothetical protein
LAAASLPSIAAYIFVIKHHLCPRAKSVLALAIVHPTQVSGD